MATRPVRVPDLLPGMCVRYPMGPSFAKVIKVVPEWQGQPHMLYIQLLFPNQVAHIYWILAFSHEVWELKLTSRL